MFHFNTELLIGYWRSLRLGAAAPDRRAFDPVQVAELLPQIFMLDLGRGELPVRLAGEFVIDLHARALRGVDFQSLFSEGGRRVVTQAALTALTLPEPVVLDVDAFSADRRRLGLEILLAPLAGVDGRTERLLGLYQPTNLVARLGGKAVVEMDARLAAAPGGGAQHIRLAAIDGLRIA